MSFCIRLGSFFVFTHFPHYCERRICPYVHLTFTVPIFVTFSRHCYRTPVLFLLGPKEFSFRWSHSIDECQSSFGVFVYVYFMLPITLRTQRSLSVDVTVFSSLTLTSVWPVGSSDWPTGDSVVVLLVLKPRVEIWLILCSVDINLYKYPTKGFVHLRWKWGFKDIFRREQTGSYKEIKTVK